MGICRRNVSHRGVRIALINVSIHHPFSPVINSVLLLVVGITELNFHAHFPKHGNDHFNVADHRCAAATHQLQRFVRVDDHVRSLGIVNSVWVHRKIPA